MMLKPAPAVLFPCQGCPVDYTHGAGEGPGCRSCQAEGNNLPAPVQGCETRQECEDRILALEFYEQLDQG